mmetsp:Transcript_39558/g.101586  ORF Transcript_39558/g.101586 Transcript_39558/m.101586 type:complete len:253 (-) Transcript_39558:129-887(-)
MHSHRHLLGGVSDVLGRPDYVHGCTADGRQEHLEIGAGDELWEHTAGVLKQRPAQNTFGDSKSLGYTGQVPDRLDRSLRHLDIAVVIKEVGVGLQMAILHLLAQLGKVAMRLCHSDGGQDVERFEVGLKRFSNVRPPGVESNDLLGVRPGREGAKLERGSGVGKIRLEISRELSLRDGQSTVDAVRARVSADSVFHARRGYVRCEHGSPLHRISCAPLDRDWLDAILLRVSGELDVHPGAEVRLHKGGVDVR